MQVDDLYGLPLDEFVPQRAALAKALRADKRRDEAARVAALRKPSIAAWAVNQLVRTQHDAMQALFAAGDGLRCAQEDLLAGRGNGRTLRAANECEREAVDELVEAARGLLTSSGHELSAAVVERVDDTLHAAALDDEARQQIRGGRLERELRHVGLGLGFGESFAATPAPRAAERRAERERVAAERAQAERADRERAAARKALRAVEASARRRDDAAARAVETAERKRDEAEQALRDAEDTLTSAREAAEDAAAEHERARAEREDA